MRRGGAGFYHLPPLIPSTTCHGRTTSHSPPPPPLLPRLCYLHHLPHLQADPYKPSTNCSPLASTPPVTLTLTLFLHHLPITAICTTYHTHPPSLHLQLVHLSPHHLLHLPVYPPSLHQLLVHLSPHHLSPSTATCYPGPLPPAGPPPFTCITYYVPTPTPKLPRPRCTSTATPVHPL